MEVTSPASMRACAAPNVLRATAICSVFHRGKVARTFWRWSSSSCRQGAFFRQMRSSHAQSMRFNLVVPC